jgi:hypothetical protein
MPRIPLSIVPDTPPPATPPSDYQSIQSSPADFGGLIGSAQQRFGAEGEQSGNNLAQIAETVQSRHNEVATDDVTNNWMNQSRDLVSGFKALTGADAGNQRASVVQALDDARTNLRGNLQNDAQRVEFDKQSRQYEYYAVRDIDNHAVQQAQVYHADVAKAGMANALSDIMADPTSDTKFMNSVAEGANRAGKMADTLAGATASPEVRQAHVQAWISTAVKTRVQAMMPTDPVRASAFLEANRGNLDGNDYLTLNREVQGRADQLNGTTAGAGAFNAAVGADPALSATITQRATARGIDPSVPLTVAKLESNSGQAPDAAGNSHQGVFQLGPDEWTSVGGTAANRNDKVAQAQLGTDFVAGAQKTASDALGRPAEGWETYVVHQQGRAGGPALLNAPPTQNAVDALAPAYNGDRARATRAITGNGGSPDMTAGQFLSLWQNKYAAASGGSVPTVNNARQPLSGDQILAGEAAIDNDPSLATPQARYAAHAEYQRHVATYNLAVHADAEKALNQLMPQIGLNPTSVAPEQIWNNPMLSAEQKHMVDNFRQQKLAGTADGDGPAFQVLFQQTMLPASDPARLSDPAQLLPYASSGQLGYGGYSKLQAVLVGRRAPGGEADAEVQKAAMAAWQKQIEGQAGGIVSPGPISSAKWAQFLGWALPEIQKEKSAGKSMAAIISPTGDIAKALPHYFLSGDEISQNLMGQASGAPPAPAPVTQPQQAPATTGPVAGSWYLGTRQVAPRTPGARYYNGGLVTAPSSWLTADPAAVPQAPH